MTESCAVAVYRLPADAKLAVHILHRGGFGAGQILLIGPGDETVAKALAHVDVGDDSMRDAAIGAGVGASLGALAGATGAAVSGLAILIVGGPIAGGLAGACLGGLLGSLLGWGVHESRIAHYQRVLADGKLLVIVEGDPLQVAHADRILQETDPAELHIYARDGSESPEILRSATAEGR